MPRSTGGGSASSESNTQGTYTLSGNTLTLHFADGKTEKDVEFLIDDTICYDRELKHDPFKDPLAPQKALEDDPIWKAKP